MHSRRLFVAALTAALGLGAADTRPVIVAFGDSLTAGHGLEPGQSFPDDLQKLLDQRGRRYRVVNQGISGDTTGGGLDRVKQALELKPVDRKSTRLNSSHL